MGEIRADRAAVARLDPETGEPEAGWTQLPDVVVNVAASTGWPISRCAPPPVPLLPPNTLALVERLARSLDLPMELLTELVDESSPLVAHRRGSDAGRAGLTLAACPYEIGSLLEKQWTRAWVEGREMRGEFDRPREFYEDLAEPARPDPVVEILGGYDDPDAVAVVPRSTFDPWAPFSPRPAEERRTVRLGGRPVEVADPDDPRLDFDAAFDGLVVKLRESVVPMLEAFERLASAMVDAAGSAGTVHASPVVLARQEAEKALLRKRAREAVSKVGRQSR